MWDEVAAPLIILEFASRDGSEERDTTPEEGKFWVYERMIRPPYYGIFLRNPWRIEFYRHLDGQFVPAEPNAAGRFPVPPLGLELGLWTGTVLGMQASWMRWYRPDGQLLLTGHEMADQFRHQAEQERQSRETLAAKLR